MKRIKIVLLLLLLAVLKVDAQEHISKFGTREAVKVRVPIMNNSVDVNGKTFDVGSLLKSNLVLDNDANLIIVDSNADGVVTLTKKSEGNFLHMLTTRLRAEYFLKGKLNITSAQRWELFIDGKSVFTKDTSEEGLLEAKSHKIDLVLEPERSLDLHIKLLSTEENEANPQIKCEFIKDEIYSDISVLIDPTAKRRFSMETVTCGNRVVSISLSNSGEYLLTTYKNVYKTESSHSYSKLTETKSGKVVLGRIVNSLKWMPSSDRLYYTVATGSGWDIITIDPKTLQEDIIVKSINQSDFTWSPTEDFLIMHKSENGDYKDSGVRRVLSPTDRIPNSRGRKFLIKYHIETGFSEQITFGHNSTVLNSISPDGKRVIYSSSRENITQRPYSIGSLFEINLETLSVDTIYSESRFGCSAQYSPDGMKLLLTGSPEAFGAIGQNSGNHPIPNYFDTQAFIMDIKTKEVEPITKHFNPSIRSAQWSAADGNIYFTTHDRDFYNVYKYSPKSSEFELLNLKTESTNQFSLAKSNPNVAAYTGQGSYNCGVAYLFDLSRNRSSLVADPLKPMLDKVAFGEIEPWNYINSEGIEIEGVRCLPPGFDANKKYPLIVYFYGGTNPTERGIYSPYCAQMFAARGYVVYVVQPRGAVGFGQEFSAGHVNTFGQGTATDIIEGTKKFCKDNSFVDAKRVGCIGASYGGFMVQYLQTQTDIFAAAVSHAGISNQTSYWGEGYWGYSYGAIVAAGSHPWSQPRLFTEQGSLFNADKITTPLLLTHGVDDTNVPVGESIQIFNALRILDRPVELILVDGEDHGIRKYDNRVLWHNSIMAWFAYWLQDKPQWWNELYPKRHL